MLKWVAVFALSASMVHAQVASVEDAKKTFVGHRVHVTTSSGGCFQKNATVLAITGKPDSPQDVSDREVLVDLMCETGQKGTMDGFLSTLPIALHVLPEKVDQANALKDFELQAQMLVGSTIYARGGKMFFAPTATTAQLESQDPNERYIAADPLEPFRVTAQKTWSGLSDTYVELAMQSVTHPSRKMLAVEALEPHAQLNLLLFADFYLQMPSCWVAGEARGSISPGVTAQAVVCQWGEPQKKNSYGEGEEQWIYETRDSGEDLVYLTDGKVTNLQHMDP